MRFRQVHLDFHTSGLIPGIGEHFSKEQFQKALQEGHVDSFTLFSKCHHGWSYHPTKANTMHPNLKYDLLQAQLDACREIDVNAPVYFSAGIDEKELLEHPEWEIVNPEKDTPKQDLIAPHFHGMCFNTPYLDKLVAQVEEVMERYLPIGIFMDIAAPCLCTCASCVKSMLSLGMDPCNMDDVRKHGELVYFNYCNRIEKAVRKYDANTTIFHNAGNIMHGRRDIAGYDTHFELESLPTGGWGYDHFPMSAAYTRTLGKDILGMTGKFHTSWGEFGGFKHPNALIYETGLSLACGAGCSIGDQLHPSGKMNESTYKLIGAAYAEVEKKEPWCKEAKNYADMAVLSCEAFVKQYGHNEEDSNVGVSRILLEGKYLFDYVDRETDFDGYKLLILPDYIRIDADLQIRLDAYLAKGGKLLLTGESGLSSDKDKFVLPIGAEFAGACEFVPDYMIPKFEMTNGITSYVMYQQGYKLNNITGTVFAEHNVSYFNRQRFQFCSHQHTPNDPDNVFPAAVQNGNIVYIGWKVFEDYAVKGELHAKELVIHAVEALIGTEKRITVSLPDRGIVTVTHQDTRDIVHLLFAYTSVRGKGIEVIEDAVPLYNVPVVLKTEIQPKRVYLAPSMEVIPFKAQNNQVFFQVPKVLLHQMVVVE